MEGMEDIAQPLGSVEVPPAAPVPSYPLFTPEMVAGASFFGGALGGGFLLAMNSSRLQDGKGRKALLVSLAVTLVTLLLAFVLPEGFPGPALAVAAGFSMRSFATSLQGPAIQEHLARGGPRGSTGRVVLVTLLSTLLVLGPVFALAFGWEMSKFQQVYHLGKDEVYYRSGATEAEAHSLAERLKISGFFSDRGVSVMLTHPGDGYHVGFVVDEGAWDDPKLSDAFREMGQDISKEVFSGQKVVVELMDDGAEVKKTL